MYSIQVLRRQAVGFQAAIIVNLAFLIEKVDSSRPGHVGQIDFVVHIVDEYGHILK
jgi:hypothetical protein